MPPYPPKFKINDEFVDTSNNQRYIITNIKGTSEWYYTINPGSWSLSEDTFYTERPDNNPRLVLVRQIWLTEGNTIKVGIRDEFTNVVLLEWFKKYICRRSGFLSDLSGIVIENIDQTTKILRWNEVILYATAQI